MSHLRSVFSVSRTWRCFSFFILKYRVLFYSGCLIVNKMKNVMIAPLSSVSCFKYTIDAAIFLILPYVKLAETNKKQRHQEKKKTTEISQTESVLTNLSFVSNYIN